MYKEAFEPPLIVSIETGTGGSPTRAQFVPFTKNPNTSLNPRLTNSLYSSDEKT